MLYYNSSATITPDVINLPSCPSPCTLDKFTSFVEEVAPQNWEQECNITKEKQVELLNDLKAALVWNQEAEIFHLNEFWNVN